MSLVLSTFLTGLLGGATAILVTLAIERFGGRVGGVLATLPSTIVPASYAIVTSSASPAAAQVALFTTPCGMLVNSGFLFAWRVLPKWIPPHVPFAARLALVVIGSLLVWAALVSGMWGGLEWSGQHGITPTVLGPTCAAVALLAGVAACWHPTDAPKGGKKVGVRALLARGLLAGASVGASNVLAGAGESVLAGFAAVFPAIFLSTMVALWLSQGEAVQGGAVAPMTLGSVSVSGFSLLCGLLQYSLPLGWAIALSWVLASGCVSVPSVFFLRWRHASAARAEAPADPDEPGSAEAATV